MVVFFLLLAEVNKEDGRSSTAEIAFHTFTVYHAAAEKHQQETELKTESSRARGEKVLLVMKNTVEMNQRLSVWSYLVICYSVVFAVFGHVHRIWL